MRAQPHAVGLANRVDPALHCRVEFAKADCAVLHRCAVVESVDHFIAEVTHHKEEPRHLAGLKNANVDRALPCWPRNNTGEIRDLVSCSYWIGVTRRHACPNEGCTNLCQAQ